MSDRSQATREAILAAALEEFSERGFQGARMENIATRCGRNKALIYRHFKNKKGLFHATVKAQFDKRENIRAAVPNNLGEALAYWFTLTDQDPHFMRLITHEALNYEGGPIIEEAFREAYYQRQIDAVSAFKQRGQVPQELEDAYLFMALTSMITFPTTFPQIVKLMTGKEHDDPTFRQGYTDFLKKLAAQLTTNKP